MPELPKYHLGEQHAAALLGPVGATLRELEQRTRHYLERAPLAPGSEEPLRTAHAALTAARREVEMVWRQSVAAPGGAEAKGEQS